MLAAAVEVRILASPLVQGAQGVVETALMLLLQQVVLAQPTLVAVVAVQVVV
jgi:hypothetical protein